MVPHGRVQQCQDTRSLCKPSYPHGLNNGQVVAQEEHQVVPTLRLQPAKTEWRVGEQGKGAGNKGRGRRMRKCAYQGRLACGGAAAWKEQL